MTTLFGFVVMLAFAAVWAVVAAMLQARAGDLGRALAGTRPQRQHGGLASTRAFIRA